MPATQSHCGKDAYALERLTSPQPQNGGARIPSTIRRMHSGQGEIRPRYHRIVGAAGRRQDSIPRQHVAHDECGRGWAPFDETEKRAEVPRR